MKQNQMVRVTWVDSSFHQGWKDRKKDDVGAANCVTVGMRIASRKDTVAVALSSDEDGKTGDIMAIPRACIKKIELLTVVKGQEGGQP